jgi:hypothetical protein
MVRISQRAVSGDKRVRKRATYMLNAISCLRASSRDSTPMGNYEDPVERAMMAHAINEKKSKLLNLL